VRVQPNRQAEGVKPRARTEPRDYCTFCDRHANMLDSNFSNATAFSYTYEAFRALNSFQYQCPFPVVPADERRFLLRLLVCGLPIPGVRAPSSPGLASLRWRRVLA
jgi:hypothetical protein